MAKDRVYTWYLEPMTDRTNEVIGKQCEEEDFCSQIFCEGGKRRDLWRCSVKVRNAIVAGRVSLGLSFNIFCKQDNGAIRDVTSMFVKTPKKKVQPTRK